LYEYAKRIADGTVVDDSFLPILLQADADADWRDEQIWRDTNPDLAHGYPDISREAGKHEDPKPLKILVGKEGLEPSKS
jgi:phage terminase large subunit-like protein